MMLKQILSGGEFRASSTFPAAGLKTSQGGQKESEAVNTSPLIRRC